jgi:hypothetical protein
MYGKTLQKAFYTNTQIINKYKELMDFFSNYDIIDISNLNDDNRLNDYRFTLWRGVTMVPPPFHNVTFILRLFALHSKYVVFARKKTVLPLGW